MSAEDDQPDRTGTDAAAAAAAAETAGPDLAHRALAEAKAAAARARLTPSEDERMRAAAKRSERRREQAGRGRRKGGDPVPFGAAIDALLAARGWQGEARVAAVMGRWDELVGPALADKCAPVSLLDGELLVSAVSTAWATQLRLLAGELKDRLNAELGAGAVTSVRVQGPSGGPRRSGAWRVAGGRGPRDTYG
ncbi:MAG TPA: DciA family protein [Mycobacteriales bacterium]|nr:DciA family protein [Mycobacteriales bacterium]